MVAAVVGSSGKLESRGLLLNHPVHHWFNTSGTRGLFECGSLVLDVDSGAGTLRGRFVNEWGAVRDDFWIVKGQR
jgi:hypothetical protein